MSLILGIDQSLRRTGLCILSDKGQLIKVKRIEPGGDRKGAERLAYIAEEVHSAAEGIQLAVMEGYSYGSVSQKHSLGEVGGVIKLTLYNLGVPFIIATPSQLKKFMTGRGGADKDDIAVAIARDWHLEFETDDEADAFGLAQIGVELLYPKTSLRCRKEVVHTLQSSQPYT